MASGGIVFVNYRHEICILIITIYCHVQVQVLKPLELGSTIMCTQ